MERVEKLCQVFVVTPEKDLVEIFEVSPSNFDRIRNNLKFIEAVSPSQIEGFLESSDDSSRIIH